MCIDDVVVERCGRLRLLVHRLPTTLRSARRRDEVDRLDGLRRWCQSINEPCIRYTMEVVEVVGSTRGLSRGGDKGQKEYTSPAAK